MPPIIVTYTDVSGEVPLGWSLSAASRKKIRDSLLQPKDTPVRRMVYQWESPTISRLLIDKQRADSAERLHTLEGRSELQIEDVLALLSEPVLEGKENFLVPHRSNDSEAIYRVFDEVLEARSIVAGRQPGWLKTALSDYEQVLHKLLLYSQTGIRSSPSWHWDSQLTAFASGCFQSTVAEVRALREAKEVTLSDQALVEKTLGDFDEKR